MKIAIFALLTIILTSQFSFSQSNTDFVNINCQWNVVTSFGLGLGTTTKYRFDADSIVVDNITYFTMEYSGEELSDNWTYYELAAYRQAEGKVYQLNLIDSTEQLLYDFGLSVGDVLLGTDYVGESDLTVVDIDSIQLEDGTKRKQLLMSSGNSCTIPWVEGFGSIYYSFNSAMYTCFADIGDNLICFSQNETILFYENEEFYGCWWENELPEPAILNFDSQWNTLFSSQFNGNKVATKTRFNPTAVQYGIHNYFRLERSNEEDGTEWVMSENYLFREFLGEVYLYNELDSNEILIYDFNLQVGDTFISKESVNDPGIELIVTEVETVQLLDGSNRKKILLNCDENFEIEWIQGIGNIDYPLLSTIYTCFFDVPGSLLCYSENGETLYEGNSNIEGCWYDYEEEAPYLVTTASKWYTLTETDNDMRSLIVSFNQTERIYNGKEYSQLEYRTEPSSVQWTLDEVNAFREVDKKIYLYNIVGDYELLIHDFGLTIGDTFLSKNSDIDPGTLLTVTNVDSLILNNGVARKRITLNCESNSTITWVKGIGNTVNPLASTIMSCDSVDNELLLCYSEFNQTLYEGDHDYESCWINTDVEEIPESEIKLYPNPVNDILYIEAKTAINVARVYNFQGQLILEKIEDSSLELHNLNTGMYFLHIVNSKGQEYSKKIIIE